MNNKPMIIENNDLSEGIYAASGDGCYKASAYIHQRPETGRPNYVIQADATHNSDHTHETQVLYIYFNQAITYVSSKGDYISGNGTQTLAIRYHYHTNFTESIGLGDIYVESAPGLEITGASMTP